ncbi:hypothetical protein [Pseudoclavibacter sp. 13-3]|uniref:hypothetical protein n=1 Tax=Pseudoclavibacter sp. 13-3 TaxID=2901228 RepID=UPI001E39EEA1|nr:hypothetical protein [Pseudoclavibacter sp. 13-3]MCD7102234.1 hypothetical protein [Pseudoclavibacter sp. 13-3]
MNTFSMRWGGIGRMLGAVLAAVAVVLGASSVAAALPPAGASSDSAGTASSVSSSTVSVGDALTFTVTGFPANHVISVKIADGQYCGSGVRYGSCVVTRVNSDASGRATGTIVIPADLTNGSYWLRFLTDSPATSNRGGSDFRVVAKSANASSTGSSTQTVTGEVAQTQSVGDGAVVMVPAPDSADVAKNVTDDELPIAGGSTGDADPAAENAADAAADSAAETTIEASATSVGFPWFGTSVFAGTLLLVAAAVTALLIWPRGRRKA